jgi:colicin import membrane protein
MATPIVPAAPAPKAPAAPAPKPAPSAPVVAPPPGSKPVETPSTGAPTPDPKPANKEAERQAAALQRARRVEVQNREAAATLKKEQEAFRLERDGHAESLKKAAEYDRLSTLAKNDPLKLLEAAGVTQQQILDSMVKGDKRTPEELAQDIVDKRFKEHDEKQAKEKEAQARSQREAEAKANEQARKETLATLEENIVNDPDRFEFCQTRPDAAAQAYRVIEEYFKVTQAKGRAEILPFDEALDVIERDLEEKFTEFQSKSKKLAAKKAAADAELAKQAEVAVAASGTKNRQKPYFRDAQNRKTPDVVDAPKAEPETNPESNASPSLAKARNRRDLARQFDEALAKKRDQ